MTTTITNKHIREVGTEITETKETILPQYLDIQSGANAGEDVPIRLYNISCEKRKDTVGQNQPQTYTSFIGFMNAFQRFSTH